MSDGTTAVTETDYAVRVSDCDGPVMQVSRRGIWVPPDIPTDECARRVLDALSPMISDIIEAEVERLTAERDAAQAESVRLKTERDEQKRHKYQVEYECDALVYSARRRAEKATAERDEARAEVERLIAERDETESRPKGREVGRFGLDGHYFDAREPARPSDEDIWREAFMTLLPCYPWEKAAAHADSALAEYCKRWPR